MIVEEAQLYSKPENSLDGMANSTDTADHTIIAAVGRGRRIYVTALIINNKSGVDTYVSIKDGGVSKMEIPAPHLSGAVLILPKALRLSENADLKFASGQAVTTMTVSAVGYQG